MARHARVALCVVAVQLLGTGCTFLPGGSSESSLSPGESARWVGRWTDRLTNSMSLERSIVFQPRPYPDGDWSLPPGTEDAWIESSDGVKLATGTVPT